MFALTEESPLLTIDQIAGAAIIGSVVAVFSAVRNSDQHATSLLLSHAIYVYPAMYIQYLLAGMINGKITCI